MCSSNSATGTGGDQTDNSANLAGAAYWFKRTDDNWTQQSYIKSSNTDANDQFGHTVDISGNGSTVAIGSFWKAATLSELMGMKTTIRLLRQLRFICFSEKIGSPDQFLSLRAHSIEQLKCEQPSDCEGWLLVFNQ